MADTLSTRDLRAKSLEYFRKGLPHLRQVLHLEGLMDMPVQAVPEFCEFVEFPRASGADLYFGKLYECIYAGDPAPPDGLGSDFASDRFDERVLARSAMSDAELVADLTRSFEIDELDPFSMLQHPRYISIKVNHGFWEQLVAGVLQAAGLPVHRDLGSTPGARYNDTGFNSVLARALRLQHQKTVQSGFPEGTFVRPDFSFGISFNAGDYPTRRDTLVPLRPVQKGAIIGSLSFFESTILTPRFAFADGSAAKTLVHTRQLERFLSDIRDVSDIIVFLVPDFLRDIQLHQWNGPTRTIVLPQTKIHELWPVVLPYVVGAIADTAEQYSRVTILTQAAVMSAQIGLVLDMLFTDMQRPIRYFDLGQVLNVLVAPDSLPKFIREVGFTGRPKVREYVAQLANSDKAVHARND